MTPEEQLSQLERQRQELETETAARRAKLHDQRRRVRARIAARERKLDTRRKILIGTAVIAEAETNPELRKWLTQDFPARLTRDRDRALFDLPPLDEAVAPADGRFSRWTSRLAAVKPKWLRFSKEDS